MDIKILPGANLNVDASIKGIPEVTLINYIKSKYPKLIFNPINLTTASIKSRSMGFIISDNKLVVGYINKNGELCKLIEPVDLSNLSHLEFIEIINKLPIVDGYSEEYRTNLVNLLDNKDSIAKSEHDKIIDELKFLLTSKEAEYNILVNTDKCTDAILIKKKYEMQINEIKQKYEDETFNLKEEIRKSNENKDICKNRLLNEKEIIISGIKDFNNIVTEYISQIYSKKSKDKKEQDKLFNELYTKLLNEKLEVENNMHILAEREKNYLKKLSDDKSIISDYENRFNLKSDEITNLNNTIKEIKKELNKIQDQFSQVEIEKIVLTEFKKGCIEMILHEKQQIIEKIKDYNLEWIKWFENSNANIEFQKKELKNELNTVFLNLKKVIDYKNDYISTLNISSKEKEQLISQLNSNISDIKVHLKDSLNEQLTQLNTKNLELESEISNDTKLIKEKDEIIKDLKIKLEDVKNLLEKNNSTSSKLVDYDNCSNTLQKFITVNNMFFRKKEIINILDDIVNNQNTNIFNNLNESIQNNIKQKYNQIKIEINKHIDFLDLNKYMNSPNIMLFKNKDTIKNIPVGFCEELNTISEYWDANITSFREQDRQLTNIYEDLSGATRIYIKIRPSSFSDNNSTSENNTVIIENKKIVVNCLDKKETFGDFYDIFNDTFSNKNAYTGMPSNNSLLYDLKVNIDETFETVSSGLFNTFKQVEDGYSVVLFGYGDSGSGKTTTLLGQNGIPGIIHYGLANLKGVQQIKLKNLFEQYISKFTPTLNTMSGKIINLINEVPQMRKYSTDETKEFAEHLSSATSLNTNKLKVEDINKITNSLEKYRINHKRIKNTPNNAVSSRSHLYMVFEITFENGKVGYITLVDTAGRENPVDIYNLFIDQNNRITLTTLLGPTGGPDIVLQNMKEEYKKVYDPTNVYEILKEGFYINETLNHLIYFFNKKNYKQTKIIGQVSLEKYSNDRYYVNPSDHPVNKFKNAGEENSIDPLNNCLTIPILKFLDNLSNRKQTSEDFKPTKLCMILCIRNDKEHCTQILSSLEFGQKIKSN